MVLVFGTICLDRIHLIPKLPKPGGYVEISMETEGLGGEAANTALAIMALGGNVKLVSNPVGNDPNGEKIGRLASHLGLTSPEKLDQFRTPVCDIFVTPDAERTMIGRGFSELDKARMPIPSFAGANWITIEPNMSETSRRVARAAKESGIKTYLMDFFDENDGEVVRGVDFWQSSTDWVGEKNNAEVNLQWTHQHSATHGCTTILSDGPNGFFACEPNKNPKYFPAFQSSTIVDGTGAGDVFRAGMLFGLDNHFSLGECFLIASAAACLACESLGATANLPTYVSVKKLIENSPNIARNYD